MDLIFTIFYFLILIGIIVTVHEGGHFITAILCNIKVLEFSIGFGPKIFSKNIKIKKDNILFTLRLFPLGGFVKPLDKQSLNDSDWNALTEEEKLRTFKSAPRWKRSLMIFAGPLSNFVLAFLIYLFASTVIGNQGFSATVSEISKDSIFYNSGINSGDTISSIDGKTIYFSNEAQTNILNAAFMGNKINVQTTKGNNHLIDFSNFKMYDIDENIYNKIGIFFEGKKGTITIDDIIKDSAAQKAGLLKGDIILSLDGEKTNDLSKFLRDIQKSNKEQLELSIQRKGDIKIINVTPNIVVNSGVSSKFMGVSLAVPDASYHKVNLNLIDGIKQSLNKTYDSTLTTVISIKKLIFGELSTKAISGPIAIADYSGKSAKNSFYTYLLMIASVSIAVGVFNLLPIPVLDGGHLMQYFIESLIRKDFSQKQIERFQYFGIVAMTSIFLFAIFNDINKYFIG